MVGNTPQVRQEWIYQELVSKTSLTYTECFALYAPKYAKTKKTFDKDWLKANSKHTEYQNKVNKAKEDAIISEEVLAAKNGLKLKSERDAEMQSQAEDLLLMIQGNKPFTFRTKSGVSNSHDKNGVFVAPIEVINSLIMTWQGLMSELGKRLGDYAAAKVDLSVNKITGYEILGAPDE